MSKKGHIYRLFPGGNTPSGFYSYYHHVIDLKKANHVYIIKGGPGVGKSQLMKTIGNRLVEEGYDTEFHHCSADPDSIDAVVFPQLKIAMIDGTSPHVIDPKFPGAVDEIINLGDFWNEAAMKENKAAVIKAMEDYSKIYKRVYKYLAAAKLVHDDIEWIYNEAVDYNAIKKKFAPLIGLLDIKDMDKESYQRHLFGSAYTHKGHIHYGETYLSPIKHKFHINSESIHIGSYILEYAKKYLVEKGYDMINYHHPLEPERLETIVAPELDVSITTLPDVGGKTVLDSKKYLDSKVFNKYNDLMKESEEYYNKLMAIVFKDLKRAKGDHDIIETYYIPNINFSKVDKLRDSLIEKILNK
ncbi:ATPase [Alkaliphilus serpentinus]|uniref:ATPase n=1 Tax=Alkaliphilus serpentinus TaxID=1482731 RepID=A0A833HN03_9FIRM|nr:ATPase [Alkaliphilus serpentinus]KAB3527298.1 ATPase [Alkaliphilus serpentinus]